VDYYKPEKRIITHRESYEPAYSSPYTSAYAQPHMVPVRSTMDCKVGPPISCLVWLTNGLLTLRLLCDIATDMKPENAQVSSET